MEWKSGGGDDDDESGKRGGRTTARLLRFGLGWEGGAGRGEARGKDRLWRDKGRSVGSDRMQQVRVEARGE